MPVNYEVKGMLAKLLATEDIIVEHKKVDTACFNVHTRVLTLPLWEKASNVVYDMLVAHECGHSIFTDNIDWTETVKVPQQFVNVCEDARVEKLMKRKYAGLSKTFFNGYKELNEQDFFSLEGEKISTFNLADRANLYFKVGNFISLDFTVEEKEIIDLISSTETFDEVLNAAEKLYNYCKKEKEKVADSDAPGEHGDSTSPNNEVSQDPNAEEIENDSQSQNQQDHQSENKETKGSQSQNKSIDFSNDQEISSNETDNKEPEVRTIDSLSDKIRSLANHDGYENVYVEVPKVNLDSAIIKNSEIHSEINKCFKSCEQINFDVVDLEYKKFKLSAQKEVNYLVKEFECRKAADSYSRASTARTGVLDTSRLHSYKFTEDLFKKVTVVPDGKNHGLIFILDWSGSMQNIILDTCKQLFNLIWFCKKVSIPFEVYAFTNYWNKCSYDHESQSYKAVNLKSHYERKEGLLHLDDTYSLLNFFTSKVSTKELEHQLLNIWRIAFQYNSRHSYSYSVPTQLSLSGTPLNESLLTIHQIIPKFQKENKLQKIQCIILTDGEAGHLPYNIERKTSNGDTFMGTRCITPMHTFLRDRELGTTYKIGDTYHGFTDTLLKNLKDKFPYTNFIGIRVLPSRDAYKFINMYHSIREKQYQVIQNDWKKLKSFTITNSGYHAYFGLSSSVLVQNAEFDVAEDASKSQIKSAFVKSLKTKKLNKKILGEFISLIV